MGNYDGMWPPPKLVPEAWPPIPDEGDCPDCDGTGIAVPGQPCTRCWPTPGRLGNSTDDRR